MSCFLIHLYFSKKEVEKYINRKTSSISLVKLIKEELNVSTDRHIIVNFIFKDPLLSKLVFKEAQSYQIKIEDWEEYKKGLIDIEEASRYLNMPLEVMQKKVYIVFVFKVSNTVFKKLMIVSFSGFI